MIDIENAYYQMIAMSYADELKAAIIAQRMGDSKEYHRLTDYVMAITECELWELVEAIDIINDEEFEGENPFSKRLEIADNMRQRDIASAKETDRLRNIWARKDWEAIKVMNKIEGKILARQEHHYH